VFLLLKILKDTGKNYQDFQDTQAKSSEMNKKIFGKGDFSRKFKAFNSFFPCIQRQSSHNLV
jgi:hypothetical protein